MANASDPRPRKTAAEKASAELEKAKARLSKAERKVSDTISAQEAAQTELNRAKAFHDYAAANPDLPADESVPVPA